MGPLIPLLSSSLLFESLFESLSIVPKRSKQAAEAIAAKTAPATLRFDGALPGFWDGTVLEPTNRQHGRPLLPDKTNSDGFRAIVVLTCLHPAVVTKVCLPIERDRMPQTQALPRDNIALMIACVD